MKYCYNDAVSKEFRYQARKIKIVKTDVDSFIYSGRLKDSKQKHWYKLSKYMHRSRKNIKYAVFSASHTEKEQSCRFM